MQEKEKLNKTEIMQKLADYLQVTFRTIQNHLSEDVNYTNLHTKKMFWEIQNGLPYYDLNELLIMLCIELSNLNYLCRFTPCYSIDSDGKTTQNLECICNGKKLFSLRAGVDGINDILQQIGFEKRLSEPKTFLQLLVWIENI